VTPPRVLIMMDFTFEISTPALFVDKELRWGRTSVPLIATATVEVFHICYWRCNVVYLATLSWPPRTVCQWTRSSKRVGIFEVVCVVLLGFQTKSLNFVIMLKEHYFNTILRHYCNELRHAEDVKKVFIVFKMTRFSWVWFNPLFDITSSENDSEFNS
jgi:hypothetical protein